MKKLNNLELSTIKGGGAPVEIMVELAKKNIIKNLQRTIVRKMIK